MVCRMEIKGSDLILSAWDFILGLLFCEEQRLVWMGLALTALTV